VGSTRAAAQAVVVPAIVTTGLEAIRTGGAEAALITRLLRRKIPQR
jgi:hypothetical protein